jgi:hypothetical protein
MGYGEFDGGGSMKWSVEHTDHDSSTKKGKGARGRDNDPPDSRDVMAVWINGMKINGLRCKGTKVVVAWGADSQGPNPPNHPTPD